MLFLAVLWGIAVHVNAQPCEAQAQSALSVADTRRDIVSFLQGNFGSMPNERLQNNFESARSRGSSNAVAALAACLAGLELGKRSSASGQVADDPKVRGRSARGG
ncbi:MAG: hypothetical protein EAZ37_10670 [Burkholderiales bacterium]|nr:MAG: hypothetical protein EAZ37_10670 [Burkholderiales bacterium]